MKSKIDHSKSFMTEPILEILDGYVLSDGSLERTSNISAVMHIHQKHEEFANFIANKFQSYFRPGESKSKYYKVADQRMKSGYTEGWKTKTLSHPDMLKQYKRWYNSDKTCRLKQKAGGYYYRRGKKIIPDDIRITPTSATILLLGDGNLDKTGRGRPRVTFAAMSFLKEHIQDILIPKLKKELNSDKIYCRTNNVVALSTFATENFFEYVGYESPVNCYAYKFLSKKEVLKYRKRFDTRHTRRRVVDYEKLALLSSQGMSVANIAQELGCQYATVWAAIKRLELISN